MTKLPSTRCPKQGGQVSLSRESPAFRKVSFSFLDRPSRAVTLWCRCAYYNKDIALWVKQSTHERGDHHGAL